MTMRLVVLGAGPGGYVAAIRAAQLGAQVTLVEKDRVGGTCLHWGCIPTKVLRAACDLLDGMARAGEIGICLEGAFYPDLEGLRARMRKVVEIQETGILKLLARLRVRHVQGLGRIQAPGLLMVETGSGERIQIEWDRLILALGSRPMELPGLQFDGKRILSSSDVLELKEIPGSVLIVGGGVIGCELASILTSLGCRVKIVEALERILPIPGLDPDSSVLIEREMRKRGIQVHLGHMVEKVEDLGEGLRVLLGPSQAERGAAGHKRAPAEILADKVVVCVGRKAATQGLGLEFLGVDLDPRGWIRTNERLETRTPGVFAVGDALGPSRPMLAHLASAEGMVAAENALGAAKEMDYGAVPSAIFTSPELAFVGLSEAQAREQGLKARSETFLVRTLGKAQVLGELGGQAKVVFEENSKSIIGFQFIGPHATELISGCTLALGMGASLKDVAQTIYPHPTLSEILGELSHKALGMPIHGLV